MSTEMPVNRHSALTNVDVSGPGDLEALSMHSFCVPHVQQTTQKQLIASDELLLILGLPGLCNHGRALSETDRSETAQFPCHSQI